MEEDYNDDGGEYGYAPEREGNYEDNYEEEYYQAGDDEGIGDVNDDYAPGDYDDRVINDEYYEPVEHQTFHNAGDFDQRGDDDGYDAPYYDDNEGPPIYEGEYEPGYDGGPPYAYGQEEYEYELQERRYSQHLAELPSPRPRLYSNESADSGDENQGGNRRRLRSHDSWHSDYSRSEYSEEPPRPPPEAVSSGKLKTTPAPVPVPAASVSVKAVLAPAPSQTVQPKSIEVKPAAPAPVKVLSVKEIKPVPPAQAAALSSKEVKSVAPAPKAVLSSKDTKAINPAVITPVVEPSDVGKKPVPPPERQPSNSGLNPRMKHLETTASNRSLPQPDPTNAAVAKPSTLSNINSNNSSQGQTGAQDLPSARPDSNASTAMSSTKSGKLLSKPNEDASFVVSKADEVTSSTSSAAVGTSDHYVYNKSFLGDKVTNFFLNAVVMYGGKSPIIYVATSDSSVMGFDALTGTKVVTMSGHVDRVLCVASSLEGDVYMTDKPPANLDNINGVHFLVSGSRDETVRIWNTSHKCINTIHAHKGPVWAVAAVVRDGVGYAISSSDEGSIRVWNALTGAKMFNFRGQKGKVAVLTVADKREPQLELLSAGQDKNIHIWNITEGHHVKQLEGHNDEITCISVHKIKTSPEMVSIFAANSPGTDVRAIDVFIISGSRDKTVRVWSYSEGTVLMTFSGIGAGILTVNFGVTTRAPVKPTLKFGAKTPIVIAGGEDGSMIMWNLETGKLVKNVRGHANSIKGMTTALWSLTDGSKEMLVASCGWDKTLHFAQLDDILDTEEPGCCTVS